MIFVAFSVVRFDLVYRSLSRKDKKIATELSELNQTLFGSLI